MKIAIASDHAGFELKEIIKNWLIENHYETKDFGTFSLDSTDYPDFAYPASVSVANSENSLGVLICGSGVGVSIVANKVKGVRAANCFNVEMAELARKHNNANIITLGARFIPADIAIEMVSKFINSEFEGGRHSRRVDKISSLTGC